MRNFYPRMAFHNLVRNGRYYAPYLLACGMVAAMFYICCYLSWNEGVSSAKGAAYLETMIGMGGVVAGGFAAVILLYANSFVMRCRRKELGLYNVLGMGRRHIAWMMLWESLFCAVAAIGGGIAAGVLLSKLILLLLLRIIRMDVQFGFSVSWQGAAETAQLFGILFALTLLWNLVSLARTKTVELMKGQQVGEREPKAKWLWALVGVVCLAGGYAMAMLIQSPLEALSFFFVAVALVIAGTYSLFTAGTIALLKLLRRNKGFYYKTRNFTAVSGLLYRMKQNAVGLANICILATMVLVTVSTPLTLYLTMDFTVDAIYPYDMELGWETAQVAGQEEARLAQVEELVTAQGRTVECCYAYHRNYALFVLEGDRLERWQFMDGTNDLDQVVNVSIMSVQEANGLLGQDFSLQPGETLVYADAIRLPEVFTLEGVTLRSVGQVHEEGEAVFGKFGTTLGLQSGKAVLLLHPQDLEQLLAGQGEASYFNQEYQIQMNLDGGEEEQLACIRQVFSQMDATRTSVRLTGEREINAEYGFFLFLGVFLGVLFLLATVLIIYYKQVSEGYEDRRRYQIMGQVGMSEQEVRASIRTQVLLVFFLPLAVAGIHMAAAFPMLSRMLSLFLLAGTEVIFPLCMVGTLLVFCLVYGAVYILTARTYRKIVRR